MEGERATLSAATSVAKKTVLGELLDAQAQTADLLNVLEERLRPVSSPQPREPGQDRLSDHHVATAVDNQRTINQHIKHILETVVV